jgi:hypothetical protein
MSSPTLTFTKVRPGIIYWLADFRREGLEDDFLVEAPNKFRAKHPVKVRYHSSPSVLIGKPVCASRPAARRRLWWHAPGVRVELKAEIVPDALYAKPSQIFLGQRLPRGAFLLRLSMRWNQPIPQT